MIALWVCKRNADSKFKHGKHKVTHFRYVIDTLSAKPSLFFSSTSPSNVCPLCPFVFVAPLRSPAPPGKEAFQLCSVSKISLKLYKCKNTKNNVNEFRYYINYIYTVYAHITQNVTKRTRKFAKYPRVCSSLRLRLIPFPA